MSHRHVPGGLPALEAGRRDDESTWRRRAHRDGRHSVHLRTDVLRIRSASRGSALLRERRQRMSGAAIVISLHRLCIVPSPVVGKEIQQERQRTLREEATERSIIIAMTHRAVLRIRRAMERIRQLPVTDGRSLEQQHRGIADRMNPSGRVLPGPRVLVRNHEAKPDNRDGSESMPDGA